MVVDYDHPIWEMAHMSKRLAFLCVLSLVLSTSAFAQSQSSTAPPGRTLWDHNGSVVYLVANGSSREFYYDEPRQGMVEVGARPGSLLFRGQTANGEYVGTAFIFNRRCDHPIPYEVSGPLLDDYERVVLKGNAPRVDPNCRIQGYVADTLEFTLLKPIQTAGSNGVVDSSERWGITQEEGSTLFVVEDVTKRIIGDVRLRCYIKSVDDRASSNRQRSAPEKR
jgi:hypothetical protein